jgi:hypothetical protein
MSQGSSVSNGKHVLGPTIHLVLFHSMSKILGPKWQFCSATIDKFWSFPEVVERTGTIDAINENLVVRSCCKDHGRFLMGNMVRILFWQFNHYQPTQPTTTFNAITHVHCNCIVLMIQKVATLDNIIETNYGANCDYHNIALTCFCHLPWNYNERHVPL